MVMALMFSISALFVWGCLFLGFKLDQFGKALENYSTRAFDQECAFRAMERASNLHADKVDGMMAHFTLPPVTEPVPLPPVDEPEPTQAGKKKRKRG